MKFSENWLRTFVNPALDSEQLSHALTMAGLEVEEMETAAPVFDRVVVGEVLSLEKHPDADRLNVCQVNVGGAAPLQIVCGAANVRAGAKVPCAQVGAQLPKMAIKQAKVRGVESHGMLCSEQELGLAEQSEGLLLLPADAPVGTDIRAYLDLDDKLYTIKLTPNRSDCLSVLGVAREVAAIADASLALPRIDAISAAIPDQLPVAVAEPAACPRYCGRVVRGLNAAAQTPAWMMRRLQRSGVRPISAVVDVTNYVMLELGQPLHAFDLHKIDGGITVRYAKADEKLELLNQQVAVLEADMLVIADHDKPLALAGVMGGQESAVSDKTTDVFLESAFFVPGVIAGKARRLNLSTDSAYRFERGVDFASTRDCLERATQLLLEICGGAAGEVTEVANVLPSRESIRLRPSRARQVLGIDLDTGAIASLLQRLQFNFSQEGDVFLVTPPSYRFDLGIEVDLIEEVARLHGYENIPAVPPSGTLRLLPQSEASRNESALRGILTARGFQEVINYSFVDATWERELAGNEQPVPLRNPIASQMGVMRSTLFGGLIDTLRFNLNRKQDRARLFEVGRCFYREGTEFVQPQRIAGLGYGSIQPEQWGEPARATDFYDLKADVEALCWPGIARFEAASHPALHPGQSAKVWLDGEFLGWLGALHPKWQQRYELPMCPVMFELDLKGLLRRRLASYTGISKFPAVRRDIAVLIDEAVPVQTVLDAIREGLPNVVTELVLFDVYRGKGIDSGKKSLAFRVLMQDTQQTLTDEAVDGVVTHIAQVLTSRFGAKLRD